jgi:Lrp/AsnC family leucine-responsive transcriptional regulator
LGAIVALDDLDPTDRQILQLLQEDGRSTNANLAVAVHLSPSACLRRVKRLEAAGVITGYTAIVDKASIGRSTTVFVEIHLESQREDLLERFEEQAAAIPEVLGCHLMAGDADYLLRLAVADVAHYERVHTAHLARLPGVIRVRSSFALRSVLDRASHDVVS